MEIPLWRSCIELFNENKFMNARLWNLYCAGNGYDTRLWYLHWTSNGEDTVLHRIMQWKLVSSGDFAFLVNPGHFHVILIYSLGWCEALMGHIRANNWIDLTVYKIIIQTLYTNTHCCRMENNKPIRPQFCTAGSYCWLGSIWSWTFW